jgi:predicted transcriptional regulator
MGIFDNIKNVFSTKKVVKEIKQSPITMFSNINYAQGQKYNYDELVKEGYENNAIAFRSKIKII